MVASIAGPNAVSIVLNVMQRLRQAARRLCCGSHCGVSGFVLGLCGVVACGGDAAGPTLSNTPATVNVLKFQWPAINLALTAPYDTVQLTTTLQTSTGSAVTDTSTVQYTTKDSAIVVSPTGLVTARFPIAQALVVARRTVHGVTLTDTASIQVTQAPLPAPLATLSIQPHPGTGEGLDSARTGFDVNNPFLLVPFFATIATGDPATDTICAGFYGCTVPFLVHYTSSDPSIATIDQYGDVFLNAVGRVTFTVSTLAYGVRKVDSLFFSVGYGLSTYSEISIDSTQHPPVPQVKEVRIHKRVPYGVGLQMTVYNDADEKFIVTLPGSAHGVHFIGLPNPAQTVDTIPACIMDCDNSTVSLQFDSVGTHAVQYRGLQSGATFTDSLTILPSP